MKIHEIIAEDCQCSLDRKWNGVVVYNIVKKAIEQSWVEIYNHFKTTGYNSKKADLDEVKLVLALTLENCNKVLIQENKKLKEGSARGTKTSASTFNFLERTFNSLWKKISTTLIKSTKKEIFVGGQLDPRNSLQVIFNIIGKSHSELKKLLTTNTEIISNTS